MPGHEALQQGTVEAVEVAQRIGNAKERFQVHVQSRMAQRSEIHQCCLTVSGLQCEREVYRNRRCATAPFCVYYAEHFPASAFFVPFSLGGREADESLQKIRSGSRTLDELASARTHGVHDDLRLRHAAYG